MLILNSVSSPHVYVFGETSGFVFLWLFSFIPFFDWFLNLVSFNPLDSYIWVELFGSPSDRDVDLFGSVSKMYPVIFFEGKDVCHLLTIGP